MNELMYDQSSLAIVAGLIRVSQESLLGLQKSMAETPGTAAPPGNGATPRRAR